MSNETTDWDTYYERPYRTASFTRRYTQKVLASFISRYGKDPAGNPGTIVEIGGANSCFYDYLRAHVAPAKYYALDLNEKGLGMLARRRPNDDRLVIQRLDVLAPDLQLQADLVFSVGLIEHFDVANTRRAIESHYSLCRPGGCVLVTFPTPTWLYQATRKSAELAGMWIFPDERPLAGAEVRETMQRFGTILADRINWPTILTQRLILGRNGK